MSRIFPKTVALFAFIFNINNATPVVKVLKRKEENEMKKIRSRTRAILRQVPIDRHFTLTQNSP